MERYIHSSLIVFVTLLLSISALAADQKSPTETYLDELHGLGKERVIVTFGNGIDLNPALIEKYDGKVIRTLSIINAIVCEIPRGSIELIKKEPTIENVTIDAVIKAKPGSIIRDATEERELIRFKKEYLRKINEERHKAIRRATQTYLKDMHEYLAKRKPIMDLRNDTLRRLARASKKDRPIYLQQLVQYEAMLKECETLRTQALKSYKAAIRFAKETHKIAAATWLIKANEMLEASYADTLVRWENLPAGCNAKAAWDRYDLDGTGVKIAFLDTGINYGANPTWPMLNLAGNYLGGYDFVDDDTDPMPYIHPTDWWLTESHGTMIASNCVGAGIKKVIGAAYNAKYYSLRVLQGPDATGWTSDAVLAIQWCLDPDGNPTTNDAPDIINMSFGAYEEGSDKTALEAACNIAYNAGIIIVAASGNDGNSYSTWPASFNNVISVGGHAVDQTLYNYGGGSSNGGVDVVAPGHEVYTVSPENYGFWTWGTSGATAVTSGFIALQLQYARKQYTQPADLHKNMQSNNDYHWEVMKHSAVQLTGETYDPVYQGKGKIWAADTAPVAPDLGDGSIDCMAAKWPLSYAITYLDPIFVDTQGYPAYYIGTNMNYTVGLTNNTGTAGKYAGDIENLNVTTTQAYYVDQGEVNLPGEPVKVFAPISLLMPAEPELLEDNYFLDWNMYPGYERTILDMQFEFADDTNNRLIQVTYPYADIWCPPPLINEGFPIQ